MRQAFDNLVQVLNLRAHAPLRLSRASFVFLRDMGTIEAVGVVSELLTFSVQGADADLWIRNAAMSRGKH